MPLDLVIRDGTVIDGLGTPRYRADVGVLGGKIVRIGRISDRGRREIDAEGRFVTPGFVDGHTHMDAQIFWDPLGTNSCWHGVTTVVMGNCGFSLAPAGVEQRDMVVRNLERAEDISGAAMEAGIQPWSWTNFRSFLDTIDALPKGINFAAYVGHCALRTWAMGERAFYEAADEDALGVMERELADAMQAGAVGLSTSRSPAHLMADGREVASSYATWDEVVRLVSAAGAEGPAVFELAHEPAWRSADPDVRSEYYERLRSLSATTGVPVTFGVLDRDDGQWREALELLEPGPDGSGRIVAQTHSREVAILHSFGSTLPFDRLPEWVPFRAAPLDAQLAALRDPEQRCRLADAAKNGVYAHSYAPDSRPPAYDRMRVLDPELMMSGRGPTLTDLAAAQGVHPVDVLLDAAVSRELDVFFTQSLVNESRASVQEMLSHPRTVMTFSDSGAHVSQIIDSSIQTHLLSEWVRDREVFTFEQAINMITLRPALLWGFIDRGCIREGMVADLNVLDPDTVGPEVPTIAHDLPAGQPRLVQRSRGIDHTIVAGEVFVDHGEHTGALPGALLRSQRMS